MKYIKSTLSSQLLDDTEALKNYIKQVKQICGTSEQSVLTENELIQLANHIPTQPVEIHLVRIIFALLYVTCINGVCCCM